MNKIVLETNESESAAYVKLPAHRGVAGRFKTVQLAELMGLYDGPEVIFDFDGNNVLVGIEILLEEEE